MKRSGFKRPVYTPTPSAPPTPLARDIAERVRTGPARLYVAPKPPEPARHQGYLRLVASLPCIACGVEGHSQAAHANMGKGVATKADDRMTMPLCANRPGMVGCHASLDAGGWMSKATRRIAEMEWSRRTRAMIRDAGQWPADLEPWPEDEA